ncbi:YhdT family protein [Priestia koreensis]|uniref:Sodium:pantothenate symporter n=1 Tax=Priestia koreensis TaxID=284581 RepID=A0A0M0L986_9BACI|nr:YhdT family protein [Priestia koreensis]KOO47589.1 sodium:pantothenate symporter [Priestia koreensis]MCM3006198.1 YhdT family protein [Priestia koreensis]
MKKTHEQKDPRFKIAHKEALIGIALAIFQFVWWYGFAYGLGSKPVKEYAYIWGFPAWFFYSCILGLILIIFLVIVIAKWFFTDVPFEDDEEEERS